jgi:hypothetical protein
MAQQEPTFKAYNQSQILLLPPSLDEFVPSDHPARVVNEIINKVDIKPLIPMVDICNVAQQIRRICNHLPIRWSTFSAGRHLNVAP